MFIEKIFNRDKQDILALHIISQITFLLFKWLANYNVYALMIFFLNRTITTYTRNILQHFNLENVTNNSAVQGTTQQIQKRNHQIHDKKDWVLIATLLGLFIPILVVCMLCLYFKRSEIVY